MSDEKKVFPNYYAILPAKIRYDNRLKPGAKILYSEITACLDKDGNCYAENKYFADLYDIGIDCASKWVGQLLEYGHIKVEYIITEKGTQRQICPLVEAVSVQIKKEKPKKEVVPANNKEDIDEIIKMYPVKCPVKLCNLYPDTAEVRKKLNSLLNKYTKDDIKNRILYYLNEKRTSSGYLHVFKNMLDLIPQIKSEVKNGFGFKEFMQ